MTTFCSLVYHLRNGLTYIMQVGEGAEGGSSPPRSGKSKGTMTFCLQKVIVPRVPTCVLKKSSRVKSSLLVTKLYHSILADCLRYPQRQMESSFDTHMSPQVFMGCLEIPYVSRDPHLDPELPVFMNIGWTRDQHFCDKRRSSPF